MLIPLTAFLANAQQECLTIWISSSSYLNTRCVEFYMYLLNNPSVRKPDKDLIVLTSYFYFLFPGTYILVFTSNFLLLSSYFLLRCVSLGKESDCKRHINKRHTDRKTYGPRQAKTCPRAYADSEDHDQTARISAQSDQGLLCPLTELLGSTECMNGEQKPG